MDAEILASIRGAAKDWKIPYPHLAAVVEVESSGKVFAEVDGKREPLIRWEGHYFDRLVPKELQQRARQEGLASPTPKTVPNPTVQQARWDRLLKPAMEIDREAALSSCSWGAGQVMGANWKELGYSSVDALVELARSGPDGQVALIMRFIEKHDIVDELRRGDWAGFARLYNGASYKVNRYDVALKAAAARYAVEAPGDLDVLIRPIVKAGDRDGWVSAVQKALIEHGAEIKLDGDFGRRTKEAVKAFQTKHGLVADGIVGPNTWAALLAAPAG